jgi:hypothetical protein
MLILGPGARLGQASQERRSRSVGDSQRPTSRSLGPVVRRPPRQTPQSPICATTSNWSARAAEPASSRPCRGGPKPASSVLPCSAAVRRRCVAYCPLPIRARAGSRARLVDLHGQLASPHSTKPGLPAAESSFGLLVLATEFWKAQEPRLEANQPNGVS